MFSGKNISILILTKNGGTIFEKSLSALMRCDGADEAEILIVDSGSTDDTVITAKRYENVVVHSIDPSEFNHGTTRNLGVRLASRKIVVMLVQDAVPTTVDFLERLVSPLTDSQVAGVYGKQVPGETAQFPERHCLAMTYGNALIRKETVGKAKLSDVFFSNVCAAIRREVLVRHPFPEGILMSEDQIWAKEILGNGHVIVYQPAAAVIHSHHYDWATLFRRYFDSGASLRGITADAFTDMIRYEIHYLSAGYRSARSIREFTSLLIHETVRAAGILTGKNYPLLPKSWTLKLSLHARFWDYCSRPEAAHRQAFV